MFVSSFYCYLNYNQKLDFVIDDVWKWMGFSQKVNAKSLLENQFIKDKDYTKSLLLQQKQTTPTKGGHNKQTIMLTIRTFKLFCLKAGTKKAEQIHDYYINLEEHNKLLQTHLSHIRENTLNSERILHLNIYI